MRVFALLLVLLSSACNHAQVSYASAVTSSGTTIISTSAGSVHAQGTPALLLIGAAVLATAAESGTRGASNFMTVTDPNGRRIAPEMLLDRLVAEQDCTKPIEDWSANLKCR